MGLKTEDDFILFWYANGCFPHDMDCYSDDKVRRELQDQLAEILSVEDEEALSTPPFKDLKFYDLWKHLCDKKREQLAQVEKMRAARDSDDFDGARYGNRWIGKVSCAQMPKNIVRRHTRQWMGMRELIDWLERFKLCAESQKEQKSNTMENSGTDFQRKYDELLQELNRRIEAIL